MMEKEFLIVKTSAIGDVITALDAALYLHKRYPEAKIDWVVEKGCSSLLHAWKPLRSVIVCDTKKWRKGLFAPANRDEMKLFYKELRKYSYDAVFDLQGNSKSGLITLLSKGKDKVGFSFGTAPEKPNVIATNHRYNIPKNAPARKRCLNIVQAYFKEQIDFRVPKTSFLLSDEEKIRLESLTPVAMDGTPKGTPKLMVAFGSNWKNKQLSFSQWKKFLQLVHEKISPYFFFCYGSEKEKLFAERLSSLFSDSSKILGEMSLPFWQGAMHKMDSLITVDSAALHLCSTTKTPTFCVFGPSLSSIYKPEGKEHASVQGACPYGKIFPMRCQNLRSCKSGACMKSQGAEELFFHFTLFWRTVEKEILVRNGRESCLF